MATRIEILQKLDIESTDWVLEVGSGSLPFIRSDILADKFLTDNTERSGDFVFDRPAIICDAHYLPFIDNSFDYLFCSQLLEHLENPELFLKEIARVAKKGYIETPNEIRERLFGWPFHRWIVDKDENGLVLRENNVEQAFGLFFHKLSLENYNFATFCRNSHDLLNLSYEWYGEPVFRFAEKDEYKLPDEKVCIEPKDIPQFVLSKTSKKRILEEASLLKWVKKRIPNRWKEVLKHTIAPPAFGIRHSKEETRAYLKRVLACPVCKKEVSFGDSGPIICTTCDRRFKIENGIPLMLIAD